MRLLSRHLRRAASHSVVAIIVVCYGILAVVSSRAVALWEAPDEPSYYLAAYERAGGTAPAVRGLPAPSDPISPIWTALGATVLTLDLPSAAPSIRPRPDFLVSHEGGTAEEAVVHGQDELPPFDAAVAGVQRLRLLSVALGVIALICTYAFAWSLFQAHIEAAAITAAVAGLPGFIFATSTVGPLPLAIACGAAALMASVLATRSTRPLIWLAFFGVMAGLTALASPLGVAFVPLVIVLGAFRLACRGEKRAVMTVVGSLAVAPVAWVVGGGWWYLVHAPQGAPRLLSAGVDSQLGHAINKEAALVEPPAIGQHPLVQTFVGRYGWETTRLPAVYYDLATLLILLAAVGVAFALYQQLSAKHRAAAPTIVAWLCVTIACLAPYACVVVPASLWPTTMSVDGRPLLIVGAAWLAALTAGLRACLGRWLRYATLLLGPALAMVSLTTIPGLTHERYQYDQIWSSVSPTHMTKAGDAVFLPVAELRGYRVDTQTVHRGGSVHVTLYWSPLPSATGQDGAQAFQAFVHIAMADGKPIAQQDQEPAQGWYPPPLWQQGDVVADEHVLDIPLTTPTGTYRLLAGAYDLKTLKRYPMVGHAWQQLSGAAILGSIEIEP